MSIEAHAEKMRLVQADCEADATALDSTPFTPRGVGETLGSMLAMIAAVARGVEALADELSRLAQNTDSERDS